MISLLRQYCRYSSVGIGATLIHAFMLVVLLEFVVDISVYLANTYAFTAAVLFSFFANKRFTFNQYERRSGYFLRFILVASLGFLVNQVFMFIVLEKLDMNYYVGLGLVIMTVPIVTFLLNKTWVFQKMPQ